MRRLLQITLVAALCLYSLTACGVRAGGLVGLTVDAEGQPMATVQMCEGHIDGATLYTSTKDSSNEDSSNELGSWRVRPAVTGFSQFSLARGDNSWELLKPLQALQPDVEYTIYGWSEDNSWSAAHLSFHQADLAKLQFGTVLYPTFDENDSLKTGSLSDFSADACRHTWG